MDERVTKLRDLLREDPSSRQFYQLGELLRRGEDFAGAVEALSAGLAHHPKYVAAWVALGRSNLGLKAWPAAREAFARALELDPGNPVAARGVGDAAIGLEDWLGAIKALKLARVLSPGDDSLEERITLVESRLAAVGALEGPPTAAVPPPAQPEPLPEPATEPAPVEELPPAEAVAEPPAAVEPLAAEAPAEPVVAAEEPITTDRRAGLVEWSAGAVLFEEAHPGGLSPADTQPVAADEADLAEPEALTEPLSEAEREAPFAAVEAAASEPEPVAEEALPEAPFATPEPEAGEAMAPVPESPFDAVEPHHLPPRPVAEPEGGTFGEGPYPAPVAAPGYLRGGEPADRDVITAVDELPLPTLTLARLAVEQGDLDLAEKALVSIVERDPGASEAAALLAELRAEMVSVAASAAAARDPRVAKIAALQGWLKRIRLAAARRGR